MVGINMVISELTKKGGAPIGSGKGSGYNIHMDNAKTQTGDDEEGLGQTMDDTVVMQRQGPGRFYKNGHLHIGESDEDEVDEDSDETLEESSKQKMKGVLEDIFSKKDIDSTIVKRMRDNEFRANGIPPLETMTDSNPIVVRKVNLLKDILNRNTVSGEEKGIIINALLDTDMYDIPQEYKNELKKKL
jgi:hypothetical protein